MSQLPQITRLFHFFIIVTSLLVSSGFLPAYCSSLNRDSVSQKADIDPASIQPDVRTQSIEESELADRTWADAKALQNKGNYEAAEKLWRLAIKHAAETWGSHHPVFASRLGDLGTNLYYQGKYTVSEGILRSAAQISKQRLGNLHPFTITLLNNLAACLEEQGQFEKAEMLYRSSLNALGKKPIEESTYILSNLATNFLYQGRFNEAEPLFRRSLEIDQANSSSDSRSIATDFSNLASTLDKLGRFDEAEEMYRKALSTDQSSTDLSLDIAIDMHNLAINLEHQGKLNVAEEFHRNALSMHRSIVGISHLDTATALTGLGRNLYRQGRYLESIDLFRNALSIQIKQLDTDNFDVALTRKNLAQALLAVGSYPEALESARLSLKSRLEDRYAALGSASEARRALVNTSTSTAAGIVTRATWSLASERQPADRTALFKEAFKAAQSVRISSAADAFGEGSVRLIATKAGADRQVDEWRKFQMLIRRTDDRIREFAKLGVSGDTQRTQLMKRQPLQVVAFANAEKKLKLAFPIFFDLLKMQPVEVDELQTKFGNAGLLRPDEALILITADKQDLPKSQQRSLIFVVTAEAFAWAEVGIDSDELAVIVNELHESLSQGGATRFEGGPDPGHGYDRQKAFTLFQALFSNVEVKALTSAKSKWILVPQGTLISLPFAALVSQPPLGGTTGNVEPATLRNTSWLGLERTLIVTPSIATIKIQRKFKTAKRTQQATPFFGIGDPAFRGRSDGPEDTDVGKQAILSSRSYLRGQTADLEALASLPRLNGAAKEIRSLAKLFGSERKSYLLQLDATEAKLRTEDVTGRLKKAQVIAFATHGLLPTELQESIAEPALALTPPRLKSNRILQSYNDGLLTASEAATLHLTAQWVILSACNTAAASGVNSDSLTGLARAFLYAGAQSLLVSHFPVFDDAAQYLTTTSVTISLKNHISNAEALRYSMKQLMQNKHQDASGKSYAHPSSWASFFVIDVR